MKKRLTILLLILVGLFIYSYPQIFYTNSGESKSEGTVGEGSLINSWKLPRKGPNFKYFSIIDYYIGGRCYVHSRVHKTLIDSFKELEKLLPGYTFYIMETARRKGGHLWPHQTHQNGLSVDFMTPLKKENKSYLLLDHIGMWRYLADFNKQGKFSLSHKIVLDFEAIALQIISLDKAAKKHGLKIRKVILETNLKDELFATKYGKALKTRGIYFVKNLPKSMNMLHDDHFHIDFEVVE